MVAFSLSFPATVGALDGFGPWTTTGLRGLLAAALAALALAMTGARVPSHADRPGLVVVAVGCALGFSLLTTLALQTSPTSHAAVVIGALPLATAVVATVRGGRRPTRSFWAAAVVGGTAVVGFTLVVGGGHPTRADLYLVAALLLCAAGYAEGGRLAGRLPAWQVIAWAVVLAAPVHLLVTAVALVVEPVRPTPVALLGLAYVAAVSQLGGFVVWYAGMARIGVARASQLQLAQPLLTFVWAVLLVEEEVTPLMLATAAVVLGCIVVTQRPVPHPIPVDAAPGPSSRRVPAYRSTRSRTTSGRRA